MRPFTPNQLQEKCDSFGFKEIWKVVSDLKNRGALEETGKAYCPISYKKVYWVKMTGQPPGELIRPRTLRGFNKSIDYLLDYMGEEHLMTLSRAQLIALKD